MYTIFISLFVSAGVFCTVYFSGAAGAGWSVFWGVAGFVASMVALGAFLRGRVQRVMGALQGDMAEGQKALQAKAAAYQNRPTGDPKRFLEQFKKDQAALLRRALEQTSELERFRRWVPLFSRQIATMRMQLNYQLKDFKKVDELMPKCMMLDPMSACFKIARMHSREVPLADIAKEYGKAAARARYDQSALLCALMSWIYVKAGKVDEAHKVLEKGCRDNSVEEGPSSTLKRNRDLLANNRVKEFSNAGFGDMWYALLLEEPRIRYERRAPTRFGRFG